MKTPIKFWWHDILQYVLFNNQRLNENDPTNGFAIIDNALSLAVADLEKLGLPNDEAHIALDQIETFGAIRGPACC